MVVGQLDLEGELALGGEAEHALDQYAVGAEACLLAGGASFGCRATSPGRAALDRVGGVLLQAWLAVELASQALAARVDVGLFGRRAIDEARGVGL